mgnify:CR=1 FL=1
MISVKLNRDRSQYRKVHRPRPSSAYTQQDLENAIDSVLDNCLNVKKASDRYKIPYETLRINVKKRQKIIDNELD